MHEMQLIVIDNPGASVSLSVTPSTVLQVFAVWRHDVTTLLWPLAVKCEDK